MLTELPWALLLHIDSLPALPLPPSPISSLPPFIAANSLSLHSWARESTRVSGGGAVGPTSDLILSMSKRLRSNCLAPGWYSGSPWMGSACDKQRLQFPVCEYNCGTLLISNIQALSGSALHHYTHTHTHSS